MVTPKLFTRPCTARMPRFIMDCCMQVKAEKLVISRMRDRERRTRLSFCRNSGNFMRVYRASPIPDTYWEITVASAAPATPRPSPATNQRSSAIFRQAEIARKIRGTREFPSERSREAKKL